jgi:hypothetical protein
MERMDNDTWDTPLADGTVSIGDNYSCTSIRT